ncbi:MAG: hypothetical protein ACI865_002561 [Flavobacteriaceae bacterium]|jgi:hypothetical protein
MTERVLSTKLCTMTWDDYAQLFEEITTGQLTTAPYDKESYLNYTALNASRQKRWMKRGKLNEALVAKLGEIKKKQSWILITEPWCGDASHLAPFIVKLAETSANIDLSINLRDGKDSMIQDYLTNGGMSIPMLVVKDAFGKDIFHWGPRPKDAQTIHVNNLSNTSKSGEEKKIELQSWYNKDKGEDLQLELLAKLTALES